MGNEPRRWFVERKPPVGWVLGTFLLSTSKIEDMEVVCVLLVLWETQLSNGCIFSWGMPFWIVFKGNHKANHHSGEAHGLVMPRTPKMP